MLYIIVMKVFFIESARAERGIAVLCYSAKTPFLQNPVKQFLTSVFPTPLPLLMAGGRKVDGNS
jgi:hypothetical protein